MPAGAHSAEHRGLLPLLWLLACLRLAGTLGAWRVQAVLPGCHHREGHWLLVSCGG